MEDTLDAAYEIIKLIIEHPNVKSSFKVTVDISVGSPGIHVLCPTR